MHFYKDVDKRVLSLHTRPHMISVSKCNHQSPVLIKAMTLSQLLLLKTAYFRDAVRCTISESLMSIRNKL